MLNYFQLIPGILVIIVALADFAITVFIPKGAGFTTQKLTIFVASLFRFISGNNGKSRLLEYKPLMIIAAMVIAWMFQFWIGFTLIYSSDADSVVNAKTGESASFVEKIYFAGYTLSTLGQGDYQPNGNFWRVFTSVISFTGLAVVTICITYIVPVINNIIEKGTLTLRIASLGQSSYQILANHYNGKTFSGLSGEFSSLATSIFKYAKNHEAYPVLHHVHNPDKKENTILKLASLDEACTLLLHHIPAGKCGCNSELRKLRSSLTYYLKSAQKVHIPDEQPPLPFKDEAFEQIGITFINTSENEIGPIYRKLDKRRRMLKGLVEDDGFRWEDTNGIADDHFLNLDEI